MKMIQEDKELEKALYLLLDYQRFQRDPLLDDMIVSLESKYGDKSPRIIEMENRRLRDDELSGVNAAMGVAENSDVYAKTNLPDE